MQSLTIVYQASTGEFTQRTISQIRRTAPSLIDAFCHLRQEVRSFDLNKVISAADADTGEVIQNVWKACGAHLGFTGSELIVSKISYVLPSVRALKFFAITAREFRTREQNHIVEFIRRHVAPGVVSDEELIVWLRGCHCGSTHAYRMGDHAEYEVMLSAIPAALLLDTRTTALLIAAGSRRRPVPEDLASRITADFSG